MQRCERRRLGVAEQGLPRPQLVRPQRSLAGEQPFPSQLLEGEDPYNDWDYAFWFSPAVTLGVGTQEILKNVVAERMLGLPREVDPTAQQPWSQTRRA